jgi:hypothetical protein
MEYDVSVIHRAVKRIIIKMNLSLTRLRMQHMEFMVSKQESACKVALHDRNYVRDTAALPNLHPLASSALLLLLPTLSSTFFFAFLLIDNK